MRYFLVSYLATTKTGGTIYGHSAFVENSDYFFSWHWFKTEMLKINDWSGLTIASIFEFKNKKDYLSFIKNDNN